MKKIIYLLIAFLLFIPLRVEALSKDYKDLVSPITHSEVEKGKVNLYLFHGAECPHCEEERQWLKTIEEEYKKYVNVIYYEVWHDDTNKGYMDEVKKVLQVTRDGVPLTIVGEKSYVGYSESIGSMIENQIKEYAELDHNPYEINIPFLGVVNIKEVSIPFVAVILGFIDGFNPCAMWILLFLINMLFGIKNKKKSWVLGLTFLFVSGFVYFLSMIGMNFVLGVTTIQWIKIAIAIFILIAGILNLKKYLKIRNEEAGCTVVDTKKRKNLMTKMRKIMSSNSFLFSFLGIIVLAISVNLIELACSLGFPLIFTEILALNEVHGLSKFIYLLIYIFFYLIDDIVIFVISMVTLEATGITNKYNKLSTLISAIIMILMGLLLLFKPDWLMLNF